MNFGNLHWVGDWGISRALFLSVIFSSLYLVLGTLVPDLPVFTLNWLIATAPIWLPAAPLGGGGKGGGWDGPAQLPFQSEADSS